MYIFLTISEQYSLCKTILEIREICENTLASRQHRYEIEDLNSH